MQCIQLSHHTTFSADRKASYLSQSACHSGENGTVPPVVRDTAHGARRYRNVAAAAAARARRVAIAAGQGGWRRQAAGAGHPGVRRLHRGHGQQQRRPHAHQVQLQAIRQGPQRRRPHRTLLQRQDSDGLRRFVSRAASCDADSSTSLINEQSLYGCLCSFTARLERSGSGVSRHRPQRRRPLHGRQLRVWGHRLRPAHLHSRGKQQTNDPR
jgi:hypothetical protein